AALARPSRAESLEELRAATVFTTHTPVPAGNEAFDEALVREELGPLLERSRLEWDEVLALGEHDGEGFGMTPLALRTSGHPNGVAKLHGAVSREMWAPLWPGVSVGEVPIQHITNGVHAPSWIAGPLRALLEAAGVDPAAPPGEEHWERARALDGPALWD